MLFPKTKQLLLSVANEIAANAGEQAASLRIANTIDKLQVSDLDKTQLLVGWLFEALDRNREESIATTAAAYERMLESVEADS
jgi:hypothetical protein